MIAAVLAQQPARSRGRLAGRSVMGAGCQWRPACPNKPTTRALHWGRTPFPICTACADQARGRRDFVVLAPEPGRAG